MLNKNKYNSYFKILFLLLVCIFSLTACKSKTQEVSNQTVNLPQVSYKYDQDQVVDFKNRLITEDTARYEGLILSGKPFLVKPDTLPSSLFYDSGIHIDYPEDGVRGLYISGELIGDPNYVNYIINYIDNTDLNTVVVDFKDDYGQIIPANDSTDPLVQASTISSIDYKSILKQFEAHKIYPIARITSFKDNMLAENHPEFSFVDPNTNAVWQDANGASFINPFMPEVQNYVINVAKEAAKMGFKDIQFDYVRFPEGFFEIADTLQYELGDYASFVSDDPDKSGNERTRAINNFLNLASESLAPYGVNISADVFGYTTVAGDTYDVRGIGQNIGQIAENVDVVSAMIYPSHWGNGFFGLDYPDLYPYEVVDNYMYSEKMVFQNVQNKVTSRPWLQDFTDYSKPEGSFQVYGSEQVQAQINALAMNDIREYLLWNASGEYSTGVDYKVEKNEFGEVHVDQVPILDAYDETVTYSDNN